MTSRRTSDTRSREAIEDILTCPISHEIMKDPVVLIQTGHTYDRESLCACLLEFPTLCPSSNQTFIERLQHVPNLNVRKLLMLSYGDEAYRPYDDSDFWEKYKCLWNGEKLFQVGRRFADGSHGVSQDYAKAAHHYRLAAAQGHATAQFKLAWLYSNGLGVPRNNEKASHYVRLAADQGNAKAQHVLGCLFHDGLGVRKDYDKAWYYLELAASQGHASAQSSLGHLYLNGFGVPQDFHMARQYYQTSADQGHAVAQNYLGYLYNRGYGVPQQFDVAKHYFKLAADQGYAEAQNNLGLLYQEGGYGMQQNIARRGISSNLRPSRVMFKQKRTFVNSMIVSTGVITRVKCPHLPLKGPCMVANMCCLACCATFVA